MSEQRTQAPPGGAQPPQRAATRRPLPALIGLLALVLLTALVWWRVLHRDKPSTHKAASCDTTTSRVIPHPAAVTVAVLNSTQRKGIAEAVANHLKHRGFVHVSYGNDTGHTMVTGVAEIRFEPTQRQAAKLVQLYFTGSTLVPLPDGSGSGITVSLGAKYHQTNTSPVVKKEIASQQLTFAPSSSTGATTGRSAASRPSAGACSSS